MEVRRRRKFHKQQTFASNRSRRNNRPDYCTIFKMGKK